MTRRRHVVPVVQELSAFGGFRFPTEVILLAVRWYLRYGLSYRDLEELFAERGVEVDHVTLVRWVQRFTPLLVGAARPYRHAGGHRWSVDETYVKVSGVWRYVYRAVDEEGQIVDVFVSKRRDTTAATTVLHQRVALSRRTGRDHHRLFAGAGTRDRRSRSLRVSQHRALSQRSCRMRPRPPEVTTETDPRIEDRPDCQRGHPRTRVHAEPQARSLRTRS